MKKLAMFGIAFAAAGAWAVDLPDPVIWWTMDAIEDGVVRDVSGHGWDLTNLGADVYVTNMAAKGNALWLSGTSDTWAKRDNQPSLTSRTLSFWIWRNEYPGDCRANASTTEDIRQSSMPNIFYNLSALFVRSNNNMVDNANPQFGVSSRDLVSWYGSGGTLNGHYFGYGSYPTFKLGAWTHICYSIDVKGAATVGAQTIHTFDAKVYINGVPHITVTDGVTTNGSSSTAIWVGNISSHLRPFCGALDEVRVFDSALTAEQVAAEYARISACHARLVARWPLDTFSERDAGGSYTSPVTAGFLVGLGGGYDMTFNDHTCVTNGPAETSAVHFDGTTTTRGTVAAIPYKLEDFTIACWLHMPTNAYIIRISGQSNNFPRLFSYDLFDVHFTRGVKDRTVQYTVPGRSGVQTFNVACLPKGVWQHLTFVYRSVLDSETGTRTGTQFEAWLNGKRMAVDDSITWKAIDRDKQFTVGTATHSGNSTRVLEGDVRDIHIYNGALSAEDIEALYRGAAAVDAGTDFTVNCASAVLCGTVAADGNPVAASYAGTVAWTQVSGPATATFARAGNPVTEVTLPAEGTYVFRLETTTRVGDTRADTVTVTRDDAAAATVVPGLDLAAELAMHASLTNGLIMHYPVPAATNELLSVGEAISGTRNISIDWTNGRLDTGIRGYAMRAQGKSGVLNTARVFSETQHETTGNWPPIEEWRTVAAWIRHDGNDETPWYAAPWFSVPYTLNLCYGKFNDYTRWIEADNAGFTIQQFGMSGLHTRMVYDLPYSITSRWAHVCAVVNRHDTTKSHFYLDGVELTASTVAGGTYGNDPSKFQSSYSNYIGQAVGGRVQGSDHPIHIGSLPVTSSINGTMTSVVSNTMTHAVAYRVFPGAVDDIRVYNRPLSADEIAYLAAHPDVAGNLAPYIGDVGAGNVTMSSRIAKAFAPETADDGLPAGSSVTYEWEVLTGDPADVVFADKTAAATQVMVTKVGNYSFRLKATDGERVTYGKAIVCEVLQAGTMIILK